MSGIAWVVLLTLLAGCVGTSYNLATRHEEYTITSTEQEVEMGRKLAQRAEQELAPVADEAVQERVRAIGARVAAVCDRRELLYHFTVVEEDEINAFSLPGGYIFVNRSLVEKTGSDDELAAVLAHEIAHVAARHAVKRHEANLGSSVVQLGSLVAARRGADTDGLGLVLQAARLAYAREDELAADRLSVRYVKAAGFDPSSILTFLRRLRAIHQDQVQYLPRGVIRPHYAMTHPFIPDRIRAVKEELFGVADYVDYLNVPE